jgi:hypothetical protein
VKKAISIIFAVCVLFSGVHLTVSTHYCGGMMVDKAVSLIGKIASCGMEECENSCPVHGSHLKSTCCQNVVYLYSVDNHYTTATSIMTKFQPDNLTIFCLYANVPVNSPFDLKPSYKNEYPPGVLMSTRVYLSDICVFRI